jgi:hypothetical protein
MKKATFVLMLAVFGIVLGSLALTTGAEAKGRVNCEKLPCLAEAFPDGSVYICCEYQVIRNKCVPIDSACYWEYPNPE